MEFSDVLERITPATDTVALCLAGDLLAEHKRLDEQLRKLKDWQPASIADTDPRHELAERIRDLEEQCKAAEVIFTFQALGQRRYRELLDAHQAGADPGARFNTKTFPTALIAASSHDPRMTPAQVESLCDRLSDGQVQELFGAALRVNEATTRVPFSPTASELTPS